MRDVFEKLFWMADRDVVEEDKVLVNLPHVAHMRNHRNTELFRQQAHRDEFADAAEPRAVRLQEAHTSGLQIVLEDDPDRHVLSQRDGERSHLLGQSLMRVYIVRMSRLLDP